MERWLRLGGDAQQQTHFPRQKLPGPGVYVVFGRAERSSAQPMEYFERKKKLSQPNSR